MSIGWEMPIDSPQSDFGTLNLPATGARPPRTVAKAIERMPQDPRRWRQEGWRAGSSAPLVADVSTSAALLRAFLMDSIPPAAAVCYFATHRHNITVNDTVPDTILVDMATFNGERVSIPETIFVDMAMVNGERVTVPDQINLSRHGDGER